MRLCDSFSKESVDGQTRTFCPDACCQGLTSQGAKKKVVLRCKKLNDILNPQNYKDQLWKGSSSKKS